MKILKYIQYRMQGHTKEETYYKMAIHNECTFEEYKKFYYKKVKDINNKSLFNSLYGKMVKVGETNVKNERTSKHKRKVNRT